jgi:TPR repeat protein
MRGVYLVVSILLLLECITLCFCYVGVSEDDEDLIRQEQIKTDAKRQQNEGTTPATPRKPKPSRQEEINKDLLYEYLQRKKNSDQTLQDILLQESEADKNHKQHLHDSHEQIKMDLYEKSLNLLTEQQYSEAINLLQQATESNNPLAAYKLGTLYLVSDFNKTI